MAEVAALRFGNRGVLIANQTKRAVLELLVG